jgi:hypothetical protein
MIDKGVYTGFLFIKKIIGAQPRDLSPASTVAARVKNLNLLLQDVWYGWLYWVLAGKTDQ